MSIALFGDHLWQSTACVVVAWLLALVLRRNRASIRYAIWLAASLKFLIPFSLLMALGSYLDFGRRDPGQGEVPAPVRIVRWSRPLLTPASSVMLVRAERTLPAETWISGSSALFALWCAGFATVILYRYKGGFRLRRLVRDSRRLYWGRELEALKRAQGHNGREEVRLASTSSLIEPGVYGILDPILLLPDGIADRLTDAQLESILAHEVAHTRRRDNLFALIHATVEAVFWFHPAVWWLGMRLLEERELACDEHVLGRQTDPESYAAAILAVCEFYLSLPSARVAGITGSNLRKRIESIMLRGESARLSAPRKVLLAAVAVAAVSLPIAAGAIQRPAPVAGSPRLSFDVASIRLHPDQKDPEGIPPPPPAEGMEGGPGPNSDPEQGPPVIRTFPGGRLIARSATLRGLIRDAYPVRPGWRLDPWRLAGGAEWTRSTKYDIEARSANGKPEQMVAMLQSLLADRFKLKLHWETRELPIYELTRAKNGLKLAEWKEGTCLDYAGQGVPPAPPPPPPPPPPGAGSSDPVTPLRGNYANHPCGIYVQLFGDTSQFFALKATVTELVPVLEFFMKRTISDRTGYTRTFNADVVYQDPVFGSALEEQTGLKLESRRGPVSVLVIDSVERPTEN